MVTTVISNRCQNGMFTSVKFGFFHSQILLAIFISEEPRPQGGLLHMNAFLQSVEHPQHVAVRFKFDTIENFAPGVSGM